VVLSSQWMSMGSKNNIGPHWHSFYEQKKTLKKESQAGLE